ncbi:MAG TPA: antitoxin Xre-like helix-turn-helix domain-containing protein [Chitinophagaceae bacterium]
MAKKESYKKYPTAAPKVSKVEEPVTEYKTIKKAPIIPDFPYRKFEKIAILVPFTQKEWAHILHLSERTLQRYSNDNSSFEGIYVDRILHIEELVRMGLETFINADALYRWLKKEKHVLGKTLNFESLYSTKGIQDTIDQIGRIQYGIYT